MQASIRRLYLQTLTVLPNNFNGSTNGGIFHPARTRPRVQRQAARKISNSYYAWRPNLRDESDNHVVELAVAGAASAIVTRNVRDFQIGAELKFPGLDILTPVQLLRGEP